VFPLKLSNRELIAKRPKLRKAIHLHEAKIASRNPPRREYMVSGYVDPLILPKGRGLALIEKKNPDISGLSLSHCLSP
jgi:hypothetical protein